MRMEVPISVLTGGRMPNRAHPTSDAGADLFIRAIVDALRWQEDGRRFTVYEFGSIPDGIDPDVLSHINYDPSSGKYGYELNPDERVSLGLGVAVDLPIGTVGFVKPRGSSIRGKNKEWLEIVNTDVPIDAGFHGELWLELANRDKQPFLIRRNMRLCQLVIQPVVMVSFRKSEAFSLSERGCHANGSTG